MNIRIHRSKKPYVLVDNEMICDGRLHLESRWVMICIDYLKEQDIPCTLEAIAEQSQFAPELVLDCIKELRKYGYVETADPE